MRRTKPLAKIQFILGLLGEEGVVKINELMGVFPGSGSVHQNPGSMGAAYTVSRDALLWVRLFAIGKLLCA